MLDKKQPNKKICVQLTEQQWEYVQSIVSEITDHEELVVDLFPNRATRTAAKNAVESMNIQIARRKSITELSNQKIGPIHGRRR